jgi:heat-inducible transcriptional repressor
MAGVVMVPRREQISLRQVEFLPLSHNRVLVILVVNEREVQNRIIQTQRNYSAAELQQIANYLNQLCAGQDLRRVRQTLLNEMDDTRSSMNQLMADAIQMAQQAFTEEEPSGDILLAGQTNLMSYEEMGNLEKLRKLFDAFNRKRDILQLLDQSLHADGVQIFIGDESGYEVLDECSVVASPYKVDGQIIGVLGVIGPTRMAYDRVIPIVDVTAQLLGATLNQIK